MHDGPAQHVNLCWCVRHDFQSRNLKTGCGCNRWPMYSRCQQPQKQKQVNMLLSDIWQTSNMYAEKRCDSVDILMHLAADVVYRCG